MAKKLKAEERIGMEFTSNEGCKFYIKEYVNSHDVTVKFMDEYGAEVHTQWNKCEDGGIKNPYFKSVFGVGCLGEGDFVIKVNGKLTKEHALWRNMLKRCYSNKYHEKQPTYIGTTVCDRWLCYANFLEDLPLIENYEEWINSGERMSLDKDLKQVGVENKVYSLETVKFITVGENSRESAKRMHNKKTKNK